MRITIRVRHTPRLCHPYTATQKGEAVYGWGSTAAEARACLSRNIAFAHAERAQLIASMRQACAEMRDSTRLCGCTLDNCCRSAWRIAAGQSTVDIEHAKARHGSDARDFAA